MVRKCEWHGDTVFSLTSKKGRKDTWRCLKCGNEQTKAIQRTLKHKAVDVLGGKCMICDYDIYIGALEFHHLDPSTKSFQLSVGNLGKPWDRVLAEIEKCALLCSCCHKEVHAGVALLTDRR
jgi:hypothetical protein